MEIELTHLICVSEIEMQHSLTNMVNIMNLVMNNIIIKFHCKDFRV